MAFCSVHVKKHGVLLAAGVGFAMATLLGAATPEAVKAHHEHHKHNIGEANVVLDNTTPVVSAPVVMTPTPVVFPTTVILPAVIPIQNPNVRLGFRAGTNLLTR